MCLYCSLLVLRTNPIPKMMSYKRLKSHWTIATAKHKSKPTTISATPRNTLFYPYSSPRPIWSYTFTMLQKALFSYNFILLHVICTNLFLFWLGSSLIGNLPVLVLNHLHTLLLQYWMLNAPPWEHTALDRS